MSAGAGTLLPPALPPKLAAEAEADQSLLIMMQELTRTLEKRNLDRAVMLARQAAAGRGPLVDHFAELGRRYAHLLDAAPKTSLRVVEGGKS